MCEGFTTYSRLSSVLRINKHPLPFNNSSQIRTNFLDDFPVAYLIYFSIKSDDSDKVNKLWKSLIRINKKVVFSYICRTEMYSFSTEKYTKSTDDTNH